MVPEGNFWKVLPIPMLTFLTSLGPMMESSILAETNHTLHKLG